MRARGIIAGARRNVLPPADYVTSLTGSGTRSAGIVGYSGTYSPSNVSPTPTIWVDVLDGASLIATEEAETVSSGLFSGAVTAADGATLRVEAISGATKTSTSGQIGTTVTMELP
jgi:hypothetical protein